MATVVTIAQSVRDLAGGLDHFEVAAHSMRSLLAALDVRHPGLAEHVRSTMAVAIDGEFQPDPWELALQPNAQVVFIPLIAGG